jgi:hypothetical protein
MIQTGDILVVRYLRPNWFNRATELMGGVSHHNELACEGRNGMQALFAHRPQCEMIPYALRVEQYERGELVFATYRHHRLDSRLGAADYGLSIAGSLRTMAALRLPYDVSGIVSFARNLLRNKLGLRSVMRQHEHNVWCTETCDIAYFVAGLDLLDAIPPQPLPAPIHVERCVRAGTLRLVEDYGMHEMIMGA